MPEIRRAVLAAVALLGLAACQGNKEPPATNEASEAPSPEAVTPTSDVGAMGADATAAPAPGDSAATAASHP